MSAQILENRRLSPDAHSLVSVACDEAVDQIEYGEQNVADNHASNQDLTSRLIAVIGLGYVGLPLAVSFAQHQPIIGFDIDVSRIAELKDGHDKTGSVSSAELSTGNLTFTSDPEKIKHSNFYVIVVPTPLTNEKNPDLTAVISASMTVGQCLKRGDVVVYESSVYPGATEELCIPILERESQLNNGVDFTVGYSPERTNYGDKEHTLANCVKVIAAQDNETLAVIRQVYGNVVDAELCEASNMRVAEVAKLVENIQRDLNIALVNEVAMIVNAMGLSAAEVLRVAGTKWNFVDFKPGLVGGHCVPIDPHYLIYSATKYGCGSKLMSAAREINDGMHDYIVQQTIKLMDTRSAVDTTATGGTAVPRVGVFGLAFKGDCPDIRESQSLKIVQKLESLGFQPMVYDPFANPQDVWSRHGIRLMSLDEIENLSAVIVAVPHTGFKDLTPACFKRFLQKRAPIIDVPGVYDVMDFAQEGLHVWQL